MAGITQKNCGTLFPLWSLKKQQYIDIKLVYIDIKQQETYEKLKNRS